MKTASAAVCLRCVAQASNASGVLSARCRSLMKSIARQAAGATKLGVASGRGSDATGDWRAATPIP